MRAPSPSTARLVAEPGRTLVPPHQRGLGFVFQDLALWPHLTVAENLAFVLGRCACRGPQRGTTHAAGA